MGKINKTKQKKITQLKIILEKKKKKRRKE